MKQWMTAVVVLLATLAPSAMAASAVDDNFADGVVGPQWSYFNDPGSPLTLNENAGKLSLVSPGGGVPTNDTLYLSTFRLSTSSNFSISIDYSISAALLGFTGNGASGDRLGLTFGVGRDLPDGTDSAAIGVGLGNGFGLVANASTVSYRVNDVTPASATPPTEFGSPLTGTLNVDYVYVTDTLTLSRAGSTFTYSLPSGTVRGAEPENWNASELVVAFGGRGSGLSTSAGQMYFSNFVVNSGSIVPEPAACLTAVSLLGLGLGRFGRRR